MVVAAEKMMNPKISSIEERYLSLHCGLQTVKNPDIINMILAYTQNTSAPTHAFRIKVSNIFSVERETESNNFKQFETMPNRQLLWHGSRLCNFVGILSLGLRINPQNVVKSGSMLGNGCYFSNTATKSAQYIHTKKNGIMMLCEVALGKTYDCIQAQYITKLPDGYHSTYGRGNMSPDSSEFITLDNGCIIPLGHLKSKNISSALAYDEFVVYDIHQIKIKYLVPLDLI